MIRKTARMLGKLWTWCLILTLALGLVGQLIRDRTLWLALLMYLPILPVGVVGLVQDLVHRGRGMPRVRFGLSMLALTAIVWSAAHMMGSGRGVTPSATSVAARDEIRLVQWNVMWGTRDRLARWETVVEDIAAQKPDIVILSEGPSEVFRNVLLERLGPEWNAAASKNSIQTPGYWYNMVICSRWPVRTVEMRAIATGRMLRARVNTPGGPIHLLEVDGMSDPRWPRRGRLEDVAQVARQAQQRGDPIDIIAGDFNSVSRSVGFDAIESAGSGFSRASDHAGWRGTWPMVCPLYDIDHVLFGARWGVVSCEMFSNRYLDHRAQLVVARRIDSDATTGYNHRIASLGSPPHMNTLTDPSALAALAATVAMAIACACLSVVVVARRWAFVGEGIAHSGFGGAGVAWLLMVLAPSLINASWLPYLAIVIFCLLTSLAIGHLSRGNRVSADTAIGIFMVASLAFGFLAQQIFRQFQNGAEPPGFSDILFGHFSGISRSYAVLVIVVAICVVATLVALWKEVLYYCLDPMSAQASGVPAGAIHYLLMLLIALTVVIGIPMTGSVLVTALLVLPAATANLVSQKLRTVLLTSLVVTLVASVGGVALSLGVQSVRMPAGPVIVLLLFVIFVAVYLTTRFRRHPT